MTLEAGTKLGPYEILAPIGAGGMGEVYKAKDTRLGPRRRGQGPAGAHVGERRSCGSASSARRRRSRRSRTRTSARSTTSGTRTGRTTSSWSSSRARRWRTGWRRARCRSTRRCGSAIEIADALDTAHRQRDRPPRPEARQHHADEVGREAARLRPREARGARQDAPSRRRRACRRRCQESQPLTSRGTILGTFQYMAPEQLEGKEADARSDIFAFGCVLYEMLTGQKAFTGKSQAVADRLDHEHRPAADLVDPADDAAGARPRRQDLPREGPGGPLVDGARRDAAAPVDRGGRLAGRAAGARRRAPQEPREAGVGASPPRPCSASAALGYGFVRRAPTPPAARPVRDRQRRPGSRRSTLRGSRPTDRLLAFNATDSAGKTPHLGPAAQRAHGAAARRAPRERGRPFWSPDSRFLGFFADGKLKKIDVTGGPPQKICDAPGGADGSWSSGGRDPLRRHGHRSDLPGLGRGRNAGRRRQARRVAQGDPGRLAGVSPRRQALPLHGDRSRRRRTAPTGSARSTRRRRSCSRRRRRLRDVRAARLPPLRARPDARRAALRREGPEDDGRAGSARRADRDGQRRPRPLLGLARRGARLPDGGVGRPPALGGPLRARSSRPLGDPGDLRESRRSLPRGDRLAFDLADPRSGKADIWIRDLTRGVNSRFTFGPGNNFRPLWSAGRHAASSSPRTGTGADLFEKPCERPGRGEAPPQVATSSKFATDWSRDGRYIAVFEPGQEDELGHLGPADLRRAPSRSRSPRTPFAELNAASSRPTAASSRISPNESGRGEIYVQTFPGGAASGRSRPPEAGRRVARRRQGALLPRARPEAHGGRDPDRRAAQGRHPAGALSPARIRTGRHGTSISPSRDGKRFLIVAPLGRERDDPDDRRPELVRRARQVRPRAPR